MLVALSSELLSRALLLVNGKWMNRAVRPPTRDTISDTFDLKERWFWERLAETH